MIERVEPGDSSAPTGPQDSLAHSPKHVVLLVHGINTRARWVTVIKPTLEAAGLIAAPAGYDVYGILRFMLPFDWLRRKAIERVRIRINTAIAHHKPDRLSVIAHSFGSFIVARLLASEFNIRWHRLIFCGSVNAQDFPFEQYLDRFTAPIVNEIGTNDVLPALAERVTWGYGSVGSHGFLSAVVEERWHTGLGHSDFLTADFCQQFWVPWLSHGVLTVGSTNPPPPPLWARVVSRLPLRWILVAMFLSLTLLGATTMSRWPPSTLAPYRQDPTPQRRVTDLGTTIQSINVAMEQSCRGGPVARWWSGCKDWRIEPNVYALKLCGSVALYGNPEEALRSAAQQFPECLVVKESPSGQLSVGIGPNLPTKQGEHETWILCGCSKEIIPSLNPR